MARFLYRVGRFCAAHALVVLLAWIVLAVVVVGLKSQVGGITSNDQTLPGTQSQQASDLLAAKFWPQQNGSSPIVFHVGKGKITDKANKDAVESSYKTLKKVPGVSSVSDPFGNASSFLISADGHTAWTPVLLKIGNGQVTEAVAQRVFDATRPAQKQGIQVAVGPTLATMIGLGVGIDYSLFMVNKYREHAGRGAGHREAIALSVATAGSAIVFAGTTVMIALVSLAVAGIPLVTTLGLVTAIAVATAVLAALTLLPAVMSLLGRHLFGGKLPAFLRPRAKPGKAGFWGRWARLVTGHPWLCTLVAAAVLAPLIIPLFSLHLGQEDIGVTPTNTTERQAFDLLAAG